MCGTEAVGRVRALHQRDSFPQQLFHPTALTFGSQCLPSWSALVPVCSPDITRLFLQWIPVNYFNNSGDFPCENTDFSLSQVLWDQRLTLRHLGGSFVSIPDNAHHFLQWVPITSKISTAPVTFPVREQGIFFLYTVLRHQRPIFRYLRRRFVSLI